jgi:ABC-type multidrug transport system fused ATPase/permease subunit
MVSQIPLISLAAMFYFHTYVFGNRLTPATGFVAYNVFDKVKSSMSDIPNNVQVMLKIRIALQRIFALLNQEDIGVTDQEKQDIKLDNATLTWPADDPEGVFRLKGVNCQIPRGFTLVCGPLGSGKSLLVSSSRSPADVQLQAILGEAVIEEGRITAPQSRPENLPLTSTEWTGGVWMQESVAYAPQVSYIRHGTIRENVVFGQPFWEERYWEVIRQTGLEPDIALLEDGDLTEVGEGGVTLVCLLSVWSMSRLTR